MVVDLMAKQLLDLSPSKDTNEISELFVDNANAVIAIPIKIPGFTYAKGLKVGISFIKIVKLIFSTYGMKLDI